MDDQSAPEGSVREADAERKAHSLTMSLSIAVTHSMR